MPSYEKMIFNGVMSCHDAPKIIPNKRIVLVLCATVICVHLCVSFTHSMSSEEMMNVGDCSISSFSRTNVLVYQVVNLSGDTFTANSKKSTLPGSFKINRSRLIRVCWVMKLLSIVIGVMHCSSIATRFLFIAEVDVS